VSSIACNLSSYNYEAAMRTEFGKVGDMRTCEIVFDNFCGASAAVDRQSEQRQVYNSFLQALYINGLEQKSERFY